MSVNPGARSFVASELDRGKRFQGAYAPRSPGKCGYEPGRLDGGHADRGGRGLGLARFEYDQASVDALGFESEGITNAGVRFQADGVPVPGRVEDELSKRCAKGEFDPFLRVRVGDVAVNETVRAGLQIAVAVVERHFPETACRRDRRYGRY